MSPLLYWRLHKDGKSGGIGTPVPAGIDEELESDFYTTAARALLAEMQLAEILSVLTEAGVSALVIKGAAIGTFYPDPALRPFGDLDLLVPQAQLNRSEEALNRLGYRCSTPKAWWSGHFYHLPPMVGDKDSLVVELHWRLDHEDAVGRLPVEDLWARAVPWSVAGQRALHLDPVDTVLHLCRHAVVQHRARLGLRPLCDLVQVTAGWGGQEWDALVQRTANYDQARAVYLAFFLARQSLGLAVPAEVMVALRPAGTGNAFSCAPAGLADSLLTLETSKAVQVPVAVVQAGGQDTLAARLRYLLWHLFLPREGMAVLYEIPADSPRIWLAYLWRPVHLMRRYGASAWGMLRGRRAAQAAWQREIWLERWLSGEEQAG